jgi:hypothetical protein
MTALVVAPVVIQALGFEPPTKMACCSLQASFRTGHKGSTPTLAYARVHNKCVCAWLVVLCVGGKAVVRCLLW